MPGCAPDERVDYVGFVADTGSVSKMAVVRRRLARVVGRYLLGDPIAAGGMATVHLGRLVGPAGFSRTVAVKRLHGHLATNPDFVQRFVDEARIASRVRHTNVVQTLDVVSSDGELLLILDYVHGESLARLRRLASKAGSAIPPHVASGIACAVLRGLHAAHESTSVKGVPLDLVHRDVSPQNILVGADGVARVLDFGIAKASGLSQETLTRDVKGKLSYMPPEQVSGEALDRRTDLFAVGVVLWETLAGERLFRGDDALSTIDAIYNRQAPRLADRGLGLIPAVDHLLARALAKDPARRFVNADDMARALEAALPPASARQIAEWVAAVGADVLADRLAHVASFERDDTGQSRARLFAAAAPKPPESGTTRRDALNPPPLPGAPEQHEPHEARHHIDSVTAEAATPERNPPLARGDTAAMAQAPGATSPPYVLPTPFALVAPAYASSSVPSTGRTRINPVERRAQSRTPVPMSIPIPMPMPPPKPRGPSMIWVSLLLVAVPLLVMAAIIGSRPLRAAAGPRAASATTDERTDERTDETTTAVSPTPALVGALEAAAVTAPPPVATVVESADAGASPNAAAHHANVRKVRPHLRKQRMPAHPMPVAINR